MRVVVMAAFAAVLLMLASEARSADARAPGASAAVPLTEFSSVTKKIGKKQHVAARPAAKRAPKVEYLRAAGSPPAGR